MRRQGVNEAKGLRGRNGGAWKCSKALYIHLLGAAGEMAVASHLGMKDFLYKETQAKKALTTYQVLILKPGANIPTI